MAGIRTKPEPYCPKCGARMVLRQNRRTKERFWGCNLWPDCDGTRGIAPDGLPEDDAGQLTMWDLGDE